MPPVTRLIAEPPKDSSVSSSRKRLLSLAYDLESDVIKAGGKAGIDYTFKDIMDWAVSIQATEMQCEVIHRSTSQISESNDSIHKALNRQVEEVEYLKMAVNMLGNNLAEDASVMRRLLDMRLEEISSSKVSKEIETLNNNFMSVAHAMFKFLHDRQ